MIHFLRKYKHNRFFILAFAFIYVALSCLIFGPFSNYGAIGMLVYIEIALMPILFCAFYFLMLIYQLEYFVNRRKLLYKVSTIISIVISAVFVILEILCVFSILPKDAGLGIEMYYLLVLYFMLTNFILLNGAIQPQAEP
jgi:hypothetical protein